MAIRDILVLDNNLAPRLIRVLYTLALILIAAMVVLGAIRGVRIMSRPSPMAITDNADPGMATPDAGIAPIAPGMTDQRLAGRPRMMGRYGRHHFGLFGLRRYPLLAGILVILGTLLRGAIILMVVRILAELAIAILAIPRRSEI